MNYKGLIVEGRGGDLTELLYEILSRLPENVIAQMASANPLIRIEKRIPVATASSGSREWETEGPPFYLVESGGERPLLRLASNVADDMDYSEIKGMIICALAVLLSVISYQPLPRPEVLGESWGMHDEVRDFMKYKFGL
jgi:hypothetical protein